MAPQVLAHPGTVAHSHQRRNAVDEGILAQSAHPSPTDQERRKCFACYEGWIYLGFESEDENGEHVEDIERVPCRRCHGDPADDREL